MTRRIVYGVGLWTFLAATAMTIAAIVKPDWISWDSKTSTGTTIRYTYGLHRRCSSLTGTCDHFPQYEDCHGPDRAFCSLWRSVGFLMNFSAVIEFATLVAFAVILFGGQQKRATGWKVLGPLLGLVGLAEAAGMGIVAYLYNHDDRFFPGWRLDTSWILCTVSWSLLVLDAVGIVSAAFFVPSEGDYELIPDRR
ncbi:hypothetical protein LTR04_000753 [Oleoguttula sp. CCFEE 6159]|nr:hypothetical protein LTR04_000753 [Oleoguttula sp. CCFEE 6159]